MVKVYIAKGENTDQYFLYYHSYEYHGAYVMAGSLNDLKVSLRNIKDDDIKFEKFNLGLKVKYNSILKTNLVDPEVSVLNCLESSVKNVPL